MQEVVRSGRPASKGSEVAPKDTAGLAATYENNAPTIVLDANIIVGAQRLPQQVYRRCTQAETKAHSVVENMAQATTFARGRSTAVLAACSRQPTFHLLAAGTGGRRARRAMASSSHGPWPRRGCIGLGPGAERLRERRHGGR